MKLFLSFLSLSLVTLSLTQCSDKSTATVITQDDETAASSSPSVEKSAIRVSSTIQKWSPTQPWDKSPAKSVHALGVLLSGNRVLTTAEVATDASYIEFENADNTRSIAAQVIAIDYEINLALLEAVHEKDTDFFEYLEPLELSDPVEIGTIVDVWQLESNGLPIVTKSTIQSVDILPSFSEDHYFLTYQAKGSMQSSANSFTLPIINNGKLLSLLTSYSNKDQMIHSIAPEIIAAFLADTEDGDYIGFPSLGIGVDSTVDPHFRDWLKLPEDIGGIYITHITKAGAAEQAGLLKGDVITKVNDHDIDRLGYYQDQNYGKLYWSHLIRGIHTVGETVDITVIRDGEEQVITATLERAPEQLVPSKTYDEEPSYLVKGGFIFQELTATYLKAFGKEWESKAPLDLLEAFVSPEDFEEGRNKIVLLTATIPTPATTGYESLRNLMVDKVNGDKIADISSLIKAFQKKNSNGLHTIEFANGTPQTIYLDALTSDSIDAALLKRGIPSLSRQ